MAGLSLMICVILILIHPLSQYLKKDVEDDDDDTIIPSQSTKDLVGQDNIAVEIDVEHSSIVFKALRVTRV